MLYEILDHIKEGNMQSPTPVFAATVSHRVQHQGPQPCLDNEDDFYDCTLHLTQPPTVQNDVHVPLPTAPTTPSDVHQLEPVFTPTLIAEIKQNSCSRANFATNMVRNMFPVAERSQRQGATRQEAAGSGYDSKN